MSTRTTRMKSYAVSYVCDKANLGNGYYSTRFDAIQIEQAFIHGCMWSVKHPSSDYAWALYNFIWDYKNAKFGEDLTLQQALDKYFKYDEE